jgi:hypothetical protein
VGLVTADQGMIHIKGEKLQNVNTDERILTHTLTYTNYVGLSNSFQQKI